MNRKKALLILISLCVCLFTVSAASAYTRPSVSGSFSGSLCFPTASYLQQYPGDDSASTPVARTLYSYSVDVIPANLGFTFDSGSSLDLGVGASVIGMSKSLPYGKSILRAYNGFGANVCVAYHFDSNFSLEALYRYLRCSFKGTRQYFVSMDFGVSPCLFFGDSIGIKTPVTVSWKADAVTVSVGVGIEVSYPSKGRNSK